MQAASPQDKKDRQRHHLFTGGALLFVVTLVWLLAKGLTLNPNSGTTALVGKEGKPFEVNWLQGQVDLGAGAGAKTLQSQDLLGKPLVLNFWASWCQSCSAEAKVLEAFWRAHKADGVVVLGLAIQDTPDAALEFAKVLGKTYLLGLDVTGRASVDYGVTGVPETFLIDRKGVIRHKIVGPVEPAELEQYLALIQ